MHYQGDTLLSLLRVRDSVGAGLSDRTGTGAHSRGPLALVELDQEHGHECVDGVNK